LFEQSGQFTGQDVDMVFQRIGFTAPGDGFAQVVVEGGDHDFSALPGQADAVGGRRLKSLHRA